MRSSITVACCRAHGGVRDDERGARRVAPDDDVPARRLELPERHEHRRRSPGATSGTGTCPSANMRPEVEGHRLLRLRPARRSRSTARRRDRRRRAARPAGRCARDAARRPGAARTTSLSGALPREICSLPRASVISGAILGGRGLAVQKIAAAQLRSRAATFFRTARSAGGNRAGSSSSAAAHANEATSIARGAGDAASRTTSKNRRSTALPASSYR